MGRGQGAFCPLVAWAQGAYKRLKYNAKSKNLKNIKKGLAFFCKGAHIGFASRAKGPAGRGRKGGQAGGAKPAKGPQGRPKQAASMAAKGKGKYYGYFHGAGGAGPYQQWLLF